MSLSKCEQVALEQAIKELKTISSIVNEVLQVQGFQELQSQFANKGKQLEDVFNEIKELNHD